MAVPGAGGFQAEPDLAGWLGMRLSVILIPLLIVTGGVLTAMMVPLDWRLRALIIGADCFAAMAVGLILLRTRPRR